MKLLGVLFVSGCAIAQVTPVFTTLDIPIQFAGVTVCSDNGVPVIFIHPQYKGTASQQTIEAHERIHVRQMLSHKGGCEGWGEHARRDPKFGVHQELEAFCFSARYHLKKTGRNESELQGMVDKYFLANYNATGLACEPATDVWKNMNNPP